MPPRFVNVNPAEPRQELREVANVDTDLDHLIWFASSALHDLSAALVDPQVKFISLAQLKDLKAMVEQANRANWLGRQIDLPVSEFEAQ